MQIKRLAYTNEVRFFRAQAGLSKLQLAVAVGVSDGAITKIENGGGCSIKTALKISVALDVPVDLLFHLTDLSTGQYVTAWPYLSEVSE